MARVLPGRARARVEPVGEVLPSPPHRSAWRVILEPEPEEEDDDDDGARTSSLKRASSTRDPIRSGASASAAAPLNPDPPPPRPPRMRVMIRGHDSALTCVAWSDSGRGARLGLGRGWFGHGASSGRVVIWNAKTRDAVTSARRGGAVHCLAFSPDVPPRRGARPRLLAVFSVVNDPQLAPPNDVLVRFHAAVAGGLRARVSCAAYSPDGSLLAAGDALGNLELYRSRASGRNDRTYRRRGRCAGHCSTIAHVDWSADGRVVRSSSSSYEILHHAAPTGTLLTRRADVAFPADARTTASVLARRALGTEAGGAGGQGRGRGAAREKVAFGGTGASAGGGTRGRRRSGSSSWASGPRARTARTSTRCGARRTGSTSSPRTTTGACACSTFRAPTRARPRSSIGRTAAT